VAVPLAFAAPALAAATEGTPTAIRQASTTMHLSDLTIVDPLRATTARILVREARCADWRKRSRAQRLYEHPMVVLITATATY
jgi:hypothetical protein